MQPEPKSEIILYQTADGGTGIDVRLYDETVWLTQAQMAELFQTSVPNVSMHIRHLLQERELQREPPVKDFLTVHGEGGRRGRRRLDHPNLPAITRVAHTAKSHPGTHVPLCPPQ